jgi:hypothetical protein
VNVQATVDHNGCFTAFQSGWPGSRPDVSIWPDMWVFIERHRLFAPGEFLLADGGKHYISVNKSMEKETDIPNRLQTKPFRADAICSKRVGHGHRGEETPRV